MDLQKYTKLLFLSVFQYLSLAFELLSMPRKSINYLWKNRECCIISHYLFFFINILLIQVLSFVSNKIVTSNLVSKSSVDLMIPMLGDVSASYFMNFISYYTGSCIVVFLLIFVFSKGVNYSEHIIFVVMFSSILLLIWDIIGGIVKSLLMILLWKIGIFDFNFIDYTVDIYQLNFFDNIEFIKYFLLSLLKVNIVIEPIFLVAYYYYIFVMLKQLICEYDFKIKVLICFAVIYIFMFLSPNILKYQMVKLELTSIEHSISQINEYKKFNFEDIKNDSALHKNTIGVDLREFIDVRKEYLALSENISLSENDRYMMFTKYILLLNEEKLSREWNRNKKLIRYDVLYDNPVCNDYLSHIINNSPDDNVKIFLEFKNRAKIEKAVLKNRSSINIFVDNYVNKLNHTFAQVLIPLRFFRLLP